jgi:uncharacterized lipoprotein YddW (UPF0748 family)
MPRLPFLLMSALVCLAIGSAGATGPIAATVTAPATPTTVPFGTRAPTRTAEAVATSAPTATQTAQSFATAPATVTQTALALGTALVAAPSPTLEPMDPPELRAVWVDAFHDGLKTPDQVDQLLAWARAANLNALFVQVRRRGDAYYLKSFEPRTEDPDLAPGFDALQYLIERAHQGPQRLQVHAWLATLPIWHVRDTPPLASNHAFNAHGLTADPRNSWLMYRDDGEAWAGTEAGGTYYLDPGNPDAQTYITNVYLNVVRNYDVDGVHLDQVRYYEGDPLRWGYNRTSVDRFSERYGRDPATQPDPTDPQWVAWRREQVTSLVRRIYLGVKAIKPSVAVTAAVVAWGKGPLNASDWKQQAPYAAVLQDWYAWQQEGIVDYLLPMDYYREDTQQGTWFDTWTQWQVSNTAGRGVVLGIGSYLNTADDAMAQLRRARSLGGRGVALYSYAVPTRDLEGASYNDRLAFAAQLRAAFSRRAEAPPLPPPLTAAGQSS